ncbi:regulator [Vibrio fluvialis]|nr:regulator [Vibrio fluvialis]
MKYHEMTKNYIFREFECGLTREQTAKLCFKSVRTITEWDKGKPIPPECKRLMRMTKKLDLSDKPEWEQFSMCNGKLKLPTGELITPQQILTGVALSFINSDLDVRAKSILLRYSRILSRLKKI